MVHGTLAGATNGFAGSKQLHCEKSVNPYLSCFEHRNPYNNDPDKSINHEFLEEEVTLVRLIGIWERAKYAGDTPIENRGSVLLQIDCLDGLDFGPVAAHDD